MGHQRQNIWMDGQDYEFFNVTQSPRFMATVGNEPHIHNWRFNVKHGQFY